MDYTVVTACSIAARDKTPETADSLPNVLFTARDWEDHFDAREDALYIKVETVDIGGDFAACDAWEASLRREPDSFNVGVVGAMSGYRRFVSDRRQFLDLPNFVAMTATGVVVSSNIGGDLKVIHESVPHGDTGVTDIEPNFPEGLEEPVDYEDVARTHIQSRLDELDRTVDRPVAVTIIETTYRCLVELIANRPDQLDHLEWRDVERLLTEAFRGIGFHAELTPGSKDGGKDIVLECVTPDRTYYVEIKHWRSKQRVGHRDIEKLFQVVVREKRHGGLFLSTYGYCDNALEALTDVERRLIRIGGQSKIIALCQTYVRSKHGVLIPYTQLPDFLFTDTV